MSKWLVITTDEDRSIDLFRNEDVDIIYYAQHPKKEANYDVIYFRDPFNTLEYSVEELTSYVEFIQSVYPNAYYVDDTQSIDDLLFEDKWVQYKLLQDFMPSTALLKQDMNVRGMIIKQRISSRARGIYFEIPQVEPWGLDNYIVQPRLPIRTEYRVYTIGNTVLPEATIKTTKSESNKVKAKEAISISSRLREYVEAVIALLPKMDMLGLDICQLDDGSYTLLEANKSPQFLRYNELTAINLFEELRSNLANNGKII